MPVTESGGSRGGGKFTKSACRACPVGQHDRTGVKSFHLFDWDVRLLFYSVVNHESQCYCYFGYIRPMKIKYFRGATAIIAHAEVVKTEAISP